MHNNLSPMTFTQIKKEPPRHCSRGELWRGVLVPGVVGTLEAALHGDSLPCVLLGDGGRAAPNLKSVGLILA